MIMKQIMQIQMDILMSHNINIIVCNRNQRGRHQYTNNTFMNDAVCIAQIITDTLNWFIVFASDGCDIIRIQNQSICYTLHCSIYYYTLLMQLFYSIHIVLHSYIPSFYLTYSFDSCCHRKNAFKSSSTYSI